MNTITKKTAQNAGKWFADNKRTILIVVIVVVAILLTRWAGKKIFGFIADKINEGKIKNESEQHTGSSVTSTLQFGSLVNRLFEAMYKFGTNEDEVYNVLGELRTQADWECLKRTWSSFIQSQPKITQVGLIVGGTMPTLVGTLFKELNSRELQRCRDILAEKGIDPGF